MAFDFEIPYDQWELKLALFGISAEKLASFEEKLKEKKVEEELERLGNLVPKDKKDINKKIAEFHGIDVITLVNSPNYQILCHEYQKTQMIMIVEKLEEIFEINEKEAWALIAVRLDLIKV